MSSKTFCDFCDGECLGIVDQIKLNTFFKNKKTFDVCRDCKNTILPWFMHKERRKAFIMALEHMAKEFQIDDPILCKFRRLGGALCGFPADHEIHTASEAKYGGWNHHAFLAVETNARVK